MSEKKPVEIAPQVIKFKDSERFEKAIRYIATLLMTKREEGDPLEWSYVVELKEHGEVIICLPCMTYEGAVILAGVLNVTLPGDPLKETDSAKKKISES